MESWKRFGIKITSLSRAHGCLEKVHRGKGGAIFILTLSLLIEE
jgi:hypothetical protein